MITKLQSTLQLFAAIARSNGDLGTAYDLECRAERRGQIDSEIMRQ